MNIPFLAPLLKSGLGIIDQLVLDKDKKAQLSHDFLMRVLDLAEKIATMKTIPWVDATVKLLMALMVLARPAGSLYLTIMGVDLYQESIAASDDVPAPSVVEGALIGAFPAWGVAREANKSRKEKTKREALSRNFPIDTDDEVY